MKFEDALKALKEGKRVRNGACRCGYVLDVMPDYTLIIDNDGEEAKLTSYEIMSTRWEVVCE